MVIRVTVVPTVTTVVFVYQTGYKQSSIHPQLGDDYSTPQTKLSVMKKHT